MAEGGDETMHVVTHIVIDCGFYFVGVGHNKCCAWRGAPAGVAYLLGDTVISRIGVPRHHVREMTLYSVS